MTFGAAPTFLTILWLLWFLQALWCCWNQVAFHTRVKRWDRRFHTLYPYTPSTVVITPVKGVDERFEQHVAALLGQGFADYRILFVVESEADPAHAALLAAIEAWRPRPDRGCRSAQVIVAGQSINEGQKVHNLLVALGKLRASDEAIVFADADAVPDADWLDRITRPLHHHDAGAITGYRWFVPTAGNGKSNFATSTACILNASVATLLGPDRRNHAWGGSTAILQSTLREAKLEDSWRGALSDDYQLTGAITAIRKRVMFQPRCTVSSPATFTWRSLFEFGRRQYMITRVHAPLIWLLALAAMLVYTAGWVTAVVAAVLQTDGWGWGQVIWVAVMFADYGRAELRRKNVVTLLGDAAAKRLEPALYLEQVATPLWMAVHGAIVLSSAFGRRITWARITYEMRGRQNIRIVSRG